jgi:hypothetical protein
MAVMGQISETAQRLNRARDNLRKELEECFPGQCVTVDRIIDGIEELINAKRQHD